MDQCGGTVYLPPHFSSPLGSTQARPIPRYRSGGPGCLGDPCCFRTTIERIIAPLRSSSSKPGPLAPSSLVAPDTTLQPALGNTKLACNSEHTKMSSNNDPSSERTPLLGNDGTAEVNGDTSQGKDDSLLLELEGWIAQHSTNLILGFLALVFAALTLVTYLTRLPNDGSQAPDVPITGDKICTAAGCVLASSTLLRSISPR